MGFLRGLCLPPAPLLAQGLSLKLQPLRRGSGMRGEHAPDHDAQNSGMSWSSSSAAWHVQRRRQWKRSS